MDRYKLAGVGLFVAGIVGYVAGVYVAYPGRAFSVTAVMVGISIAAIAHRTTRGGTA